jgi:lantibiotic modifying enzyme
MFQTNSLSVGFGTTGVMYSLIKCGITVPQELLNKFRAELKSATTNELPPGFLTGNAGIALALYTLGYDTDAARFIAAANASKMRFTRHCLYLGSAGIGLANLYAYLHVGKETYLDAALDCANHLKETAIEDDAGIHWESGGSSYIGLGYGQSGVALFLLRLSQILRINTWRELGERALDYDLSFAYEMERDVVSFSRGPSDHTIYLPYIEEGSAGIAKVAIRYNRWDVLEPILQDTYRKYSAFAGLIYGLTGFVDVLVDAYLSSGDSKYLNMAQRPFDGLCDLYLVDTGTGLATPGESLFRISCDYATGVAGVMRTLYRLHHLTPSDFCLDMMG